MYTLNFFTLTRSAQNASMTQIAILMENETTFLFFLNAFFSWLFSPGMTVFLLWIGVNVFLHRLGSLYISFSPIFEDMEVAVGHNQDKSSIECELYPSVGSSWDFNKNDLVYVDDIYCYTVNLSGSVKGRLLMLPGWCGSKKSSRLKKYASCCAMYTR